jgi:hypothetical protein
VGLDRSGRSELAWLETIIPLVCGLAGVVALITGIVLARPRRDDGEPVAADTTVPQPVLDPAP